MQIIAFNKGKTLKWLPYKLLLTMKFTVLIMVAALTQVCAAGFAQKVSLNEQRKPLSTLIRKIRQQTNYDFIYNSNLIDDQARYNFLFNDLPLEKALTIIFKDTNIDFTIKDRVIVLEKKKQSFLDRILTVFEKIDIGGRVLDEKGNPLVGATVSLEGGRKSITTDKNGIFTFSNVDEKAFIEVRYIGYETVRLSVQKNMTIRMEMASAGLQEVTIVNTGYQKIQQTKMTGSVTTVDRDVLEKRNATNILQNLEGVVPGLVQTGTSATIRGVSSLDNTMRNILYVVDGLPIEGGVDKINPYDVETISVLKDAAAAAIYGARASNGVIVITTKKAGRIGTPVVEASSNITLTNKPDYSYKNWMSASEQVDYESNYYNWYFNGGGNGGAVITNPIGTFETSVNQSTNAISAVAYAYYQFKKGIMSQSQLDATLANLKTNDFLQQYKDHAVQKGLTQQYNFALRTNNGNSQNSLVVNYTDYNYSSGGYANNLATTGSVALVNAYNKAVNIFYKGSYSAAKWLDLDYGVNSVIGKVRSHNNEYATNPGNVPAYTKLLNADGSRAYYSTSTFNIYNPVNSVSNAALASFNYNHLDELGRDFNVTSSIDSRYYLNLNIKPMEGLSINPMFQVEDGRSTSSAYSEPESYTMRILQNAYTTRSGTSPNYVYTNLLPKGGKLVSNQNRSTNYTGRLQANYNRIFGKHAIQALIGTEFRQTLTKVGVRSILLGYDDQLQTQSTNQVNFGTLYNINTGTIWDSTYPTRQYHFDQISAMGINPVETMHRYASGYANLTYTYDNRYNVFGSLRKDYADLFGGDEKFRGRPLWSAGASWMVSNEEFLKNTPQINYLKVRASYGLTGNIKNVTAFLAATTGTNTTTQLPNASVTNPPNPQLRWEKTATTNLGVDFGALSNRLRGTLDLYRRNGTDLFASKRLDPSEGFTSMTINNASVINKGVELSLSYDWYKSKTRNGFQWTSSLNASVNNNKVTSVDELTRNPLTLASGGSYKVGYPVSSIFAFRFAGLNSSGVPQFYNSAGVATTATLGISEADALVYIGSQDPKYNLALNNDLSYKSFSLNIFVVYQGGHYFRERQVPTAMYGVYYSQLPNYLLNAWTPTNTNTDIVGSSQYYQVPLNSQYTYADNLIRRADFIKVRNIVLGYDLPDQVASKVRASHIKLRFQVNNPNIVWFKQKDVHVDSETGGAPYPTSFVFGLNANF